jgi:hypothetical protein
MFISASAARTLCRVTGSRPGLRIRLTLWNDADDDIPILKEAKTEQVAVILGKTMG